MSNWKQKIASFLYGRYGSDQLGRALLFLYLVFYIVYVFTHMWVFIVLSNVALIFMVFRMFSRKYARRRRENEWFLKLWNPIVSWVKLQFHRVRDCRSSVYRKCPHCKAVLKLPRRRGSHTVRCPRCSERFDTRVLF